MTLQKIIEKLKLYLKDKNYRTIVKAKLGLYNKLSDEDYLKKMFRAYLQEELNLENPVTFNEKIQWLKINDRNPIFTSLVDKYESKGYVASLIGKDHVIPTIGIYNNFKEINIDNLPNKFVMKCTHDSGSLIICRDKNSFNVKAAKKKITMALKKNFFFVGREWPYKDVKPRIIVEEYMEDIDEQKKGNIGLNDYKFYCFNGEPKFLYLSQNLENHSEASITFITMDWKKESFERTDYKSLTKLPKKPPLFDEMVEFARILSKGIRFVRVDLYSINGCIYFSELTFHPSSGFMKFKNPDDDKKLGKLLVL